MYNVGDLDHRRLIAELGAYGDVPSGPPQSEQQTTSAYFSVLTMLADAYANYQSLVWRGIHGPVQCGLNHISFRRVSNIMAWSLQRHRRSRYV